MAKVTQLRDVQEWMGHRDSKTTGIYADYMPAEREAELVDLAFGPVINSVINLSETEKNSENLNRSGMREGN